MPRLAPDRPAPACFSFPVQLGGAVIGPLPARFSRRTLFVNDSVLRAFPVAAIPLLSTVGLLEMWQLHVFAAVFGLLKIVPVASTGRIAGAGLKKLGPMTEAGRRVAAAHSARCCLRWSGAGKA